MKKVVLKSITLRNFRGEKERTTNFNLNGETIIMGDNGLGKSRHFDAFMWLLFGKDTKDRKDYKVRTLVNDVPLHHVECSVSATLIIDGESLTLKRELAEKWVKPRGQVDEVFKGNETECYWNDVPVNTTEYQKRINEIINDSVFKMVTNPLFFATMKWQDQREQLFQLAGTITDNEIAAKKPEFAALLDRVTGKSFADFKREIAARKKRLKEDLAKIEPRIDQTQKLMPESLDFAGLEKQVIKIEKEITNIDKAITDKSEAMRQQYEAVQKKQAEINELKQKQQKVLFDAQSQAREDAFKDNENRRNLESNVKATEKEVETLQRGVQLSKSELDVMKTRLANKKQEVEDLRKTWFDENAVDYTGDDTCHSCGQSLPDIMKADARKLFAESKAKKLSEITTKGGVMNAQIVELEQDIASTEKSLETAINEVMDKESIIATLRDELAVLPTQEEKTIVPDELSEYKTLGDLINGLEMVVKEMSLGDPSDTAELRANKITLQNDLRQVETKLSNRDLIVKYTKEIEELEQQGKDLAQQIADVEREEYTIQQFTKARIDECERRINGLFKHVTFKLFDYTIDGNEYETCVPLVNGIPFDVANTAGQVNAGLDIINALVGFHGVCAPIFIDSRESVNDIIPTGSQIINLIVTKDKELIIK